MKLLGKSEEEYDAMTPKEKEDAFEKLKANAGTKKQGNIAADTSRDSFAEKFFGGVTDSFRNSISIAMGSTDFSSATVEFKDGNAHIRTCFTAGTLVHTKDGTKVIEDIKVGDEVLSKSDVTGEVTYKKVVNTFIRQTDEIYNVNFTNNSILETTWNHPFRRFKSVLPGDTSSIENSEWTETRDLKKGDHLYSADGSLLVVESVIIEQREETVYNFEVEDFHTYFVGEDSVWVHNQSCAPIAGGPSFWNNTIGNKILESLGLRKPVNDYSNIFAIKAAVDPEGLAMDFLLPQSPCGPNVSCGIPPLPFGGLVKTANSIIKTKKTLDLSRKLGKDGETIARINKNKDRIESITNTAKYRIPDEWLKNEKVIREIKNVSKLSYSRQIKDFNLWAQKNGHTFILEARKGAKLTKPLLNEIKEGNIFLKELGKK
jgi:hypothetical protein